MFCLPKTAWPSDFFLSPLFRETDDLSECLFVPAIDVRESDDAFVLEAEVPGIPKDELKIDLKDGVLTLSGERKYGHTEKEPHFTRVERSYGAFCRSFDLPDGVLEDKIDAASRIVAMSFCEPRSW